jgi:hypothetical protein
MAQSKVSALKFHVGSDDSMIGHHPLGHLEIKTKPIKKFSIRDPQAGKSAAAHRCHSMACLD